MLASYDVEAGINFAKAAVKLYILHSSQGPVWKGIAQYVHNRVFELYAVALACLPVFIQPEGQKSVFSEGLREAGGGEGKQYCFQKVCEKKRQKKVDIKQGKYYSFQKVCEKKRQKKVDQKRKVLLFSKSLREETTEKC